MLFLEFSVSPYNYAGTDNCQNETSKEAGAAEKDPSYNSADETSGDTKNNLDPKLWIDVHDLASDVTHNASDDNVNDQTHIVPP